MSWTDTDDAEIQACLDRLTKQHKKIESQLSPIENIIRNTKQIQTRELTSFNDKRVRHITKIPPNDKWGEPMADEPRLEIKNQCVAKTIELLGEPDE